MVQIETWFQPEGRIGMQRNWVISNKATGKVLGKATRCVLPLENPFYEILFESQFRQECASLIARGATVVKILE